MQRRKSAKTRRKLLQRSAANAKRRNARNRQRRWRLWWVRVDGLSLQHIFTWNSQYRRSGNFRVGFFFALEMFVHLVFAAWRARALIIHYRKFFMCLIFTTYLTGEKFLTAKISRSSVLGTWTITLASCILARAPLALPELYNCNVRCVSSIQHYAVVLSGGKIGVYILGEPEQSPH